jgi:integrase
MFTVLHAMVIAESGASNHMASGRITKTAVDGLRLGSRDVFLWDDKIPGFGVKVTPKGNRVYIFQYRLGGRGAKVRRYTIGKHGPLTAEQARAEAGRLSAQTTQGVDPQTAKAEKRRQSVDLAFGPYLDRFRDDCLKVDWPASWSEADKALRTYALPTLKAKALPEIHRRDIQQIVGPLEKKHPATAAKVFAILRRLFRWAVNAGDIDVSPMAEMDGPSPPASRDRVLSDEELALVWKAAGEIGAPFGPFFRLLILTGARREEVAALPWSELHQADRLWKLPAARAKNGVAVDTPLSTMAMAELDALAKADKWPKRGLLFTTTGKTPISGYSRAKKRLDAKIAEMNEGEALPAWRVHDLRRTLATGCQRLGVRFEVTEAILNHVSGAQAGVSGIYQRHGWGPEKVTALQSWSNHIEGRLRASDKSNVIRLQRCGPERVARLG